MTVEWYNAVRFNFPHMCADCWFGEYDEFWDEEQSEEYETAICNLDRDLEILSNYFWGPIPDDCPRRELINR